MAENYRRLFFSGGNLRRCAGPQFISFQVDPCCMRGTPVYFSLPLPACLLRSNVKPVEAKTYTCSVLPCEAFAPGHWRVLRQIRPNNHCAGKVSPTDHG